MAPYVDQINALKIDSRVGNMKSEGVYVVYNLRPQKEKGNAADAAKPS